MEKYRKSSSSSLETRDYGLRMSSADYTTLLYPKNLTLTSRTSSGHSVGVVRSRTQATEFVSVLMAQTNYKLFTRPKSDITIRFRPILYRILYGTN
jgi:hypothetical protein